MVFDSVEALEKHRADMVEASKAVRRRILVCSGTACVASGALDVYAEFVKQTAEAGLGVEVELEPCGEDRHKKNGGSQYLSRTGCLGYCQLGPLVRVLPEEILYTRVGVNKVEEIVNKTLRDGEIVEELLYKDKNTGKSLKGRDEIPFFEKQTFLALSAVGNIDPFSLDDYLAHGGYQALVKAFTTMKPDDVVDAIDESGLRGRGGGGFPTGRKWRSCLSVPSDVRYVICNGDEGDPGAFMDCSIMEGEPFRVIEGMTIGAYALRSESGYIYVRHEYPRAVERLSNAIEKSRQAGLLGENILGSGFSFDIKINRGGGAFVCGESSALMRSVEGYMGEPRPKYVHSTEKGLYDKPTVLNNVESWVCVPAIIEKGAAWFASMGTEKSSGTKAFCLVGKVNNTGLIEVPMGISLREIIEDIGGGIIGGKKLKAVQTGGPSGGCLPADKLDLPVDFDSLTSAGSMMGSGGMIVMDERNCMVDVAKYFNEFLLQESCGKCVPCREGLVQMHEMLERITNGEGREDDIERLESLARVMKNASLCALGQTAANPVLSTLRYFSEEYETHIKDKRCPAGVCKALITYSVNDNCNGCTLCLKNCPADAITGEKKKMHAIDPDKCTRCGACEAVCNQDAISVE